MLTLAVGVAVFGATVVLCELFQSAVNKAILAEVARIEKAVSNVKSDVENEITSAIQAIKKHL